MSLFDLTGRCVVVTGARGLLGRPICAALADAGATVLGLDTWEPDDNKIDLAYHGNEPEPNPSVVRISTLDRPAMQRIVTLHGAPDGLVTLAGIDAKPGTNDADPWRDWQRMIDVNLTGTANACRVFGQSMAEVGRGSIVTVGSLYARMSPDQRLYFEPGDYVADEVTFTKPIGYGVSKAGVLGLTRHLAAQWAQAGVRVNCLSPGGIGSDSTPADFRERFEARVPLGRMGTPGDLVGAVQFLLSPASEYVTGQEIRVDGGVGIWP